MPANVIDGKSLAASVRASLKSRIVSLAGAGARPGLAAVLVGDDPASRVYVRNKMRACDETGVRSVLRELPKDVAEGALLQCIAELNADPSVHGILVQLPLPRGLDADRVLAAISPAKDVDGFHAESLGALVQGRPGFVPGTPSGVMRMLDHAQVPLAGRRAVVVGRSTIVGKPMALLLLQRDATVTICHSRTADLGAVTRGADVLVAAVGKARMITADMVKPGACVIDVGINRLSDGKLAGDVDFDAVREVAGAISPVPGGVGPMTVAMMLANTVRAAELTIGQQPSS
jgi:methylenetetrahydrofolate dehydrogenase (NADP+)/methenyltetrahydrofolate cyclohydrolase